jgi:hypothetical protein
VVLFFVSAGNVGEGSDIVEANAKNRDMPVIIEKPKENIAKQRMEKRNIKKQNIDVAWDYCIAIKKLKRRQWKNRSSRKTIRLSTIDQ